jgi:hypothetical protein
MKGVITQRQIIELRDSMTVSELRHFTEETKRIYGLVSFKYIFKTMGFRSSFNGNYYNFSEIAH